MNVRQMMGQLLMFLYTENILGKEENACHQHFYLFPTMFHELLQLACKYCGICAERVKQ